MKNKAWFSRLKQWSLYGFITLILTITIAVFAIITYTSDSSKNNGRRIFESSIWNALQLQVQSYRFINYLILLEEEDHPLEGKAYFEFDLLMSRVDLLRIGEVGDLIRTFENGRTSRLLNIINGELELLSFHLSKIEGGDLSYLPSLLERLQSLDDQINEFITLVNKGSNEFITAQNDRLQSNLNTIQVLSIALLILLLCLCFFTIKVFIELKATFQRHSKLQAGIQAVHEDKADMLSFITQEIRSPASAILGVAHSLKNTTSHQEAKDLSKHVKESGQQLLQTVEMLSDLALIDAKKLDVIPTTEYLQNQIERCMWLFEPQLTRKCLFSLVYIDPQLPKTVSLDFNRIRVIITALLQNAIAHTPSGSISLQVRPSTLTITQDTLQEGARPTRMLQIAIRDTGLSMSDQLQQSLRINPALPMQQEGPLPSAVGLSLALCHKLVYFLEGQMHFSCASQKGCEFWVDLPYQEASQASEEKYPRFQCAQQKHALIIETDTHLAKMIGLQLASFNIHASFSKEGYFHENKEYDLIILGNTPHFDRDGKEALQQWKSVSCPVLSYHPKAINTIGYSVMPLSFPLTQSQLEPLLRTLFTVPAAPTTTHT